MATLIPAISSCVSRMTSGERRLGMADLDGCWDDANQASEMHSKRQFVAGRGKGEIDGK